MALDIETFLTTLYVTVDDLYQQQVQPRLPYGGGRAPARLGGARPELWRGAPRSHPGRPGVR
jgi:hypothetical protein